jgi:hypothetical protein
MGEYINSSQYIDPEALGKIFLDRLESIKCNKALIITLNDENEEYDVDFLNAKLTCSEIISLLRTVEILIHRHMGYLPFPTNE